MNRPMIDHRGSEFAAILGEITAGASPSFTSLKQKTAVSTATARSQTAVRPEPPPKACPWMRPITGFGQS